MPGSIDKARARRNRERARNRRLGLPLNHGLPWTESQHKMLRFWADTCRHRYGMDADAAIAFIAPRMHRTRLATYCQLHAFGLVEGPYND